MGRAKDVRSLDHLPNRGRCARSWTPIETWMQDFATDPANKDGTQSWNKKLPSSELILDTLLAVLPAFTPAQLEYGYTSKRRDCRSHWTVLLQG